MQGLNVDTGHNFPIRIRVESVLYFSPSISSQISGNSSVLLLIGVLALCLVSLLVGLLFVCGFFNLFISLEMLHFSLSAGKS